MRKLSSSPAERRATFLGFQPPAIGEEEVEAVAETLRSGWGPTVPASSSLPRAWAEATTRSSAARRSGST